MADNWTGVKDIYTIDKLGAYHMIGQDDYEPQRNNNFEVHIYGLDNLLTIDQRREVRQDVAEESLTLSTASIKNNVRAFIFLPLRSRSICLAK